MDIFLFIFIFTATQAELIDYTRENYILIEVDDVLLYENTSTIYHITNLTFIQNFVDTTWKELELEHDKTNYPGTPRHKKFDSHLNIIQTFLDQLAVSRPKRAIETIGKIWKWIAGSPDHDDKITIENKLNDLILNNNKQFVTNSKIFDAIKNVKRDIKDDLIAEKCNLIILELQNIITTLTLAKLGILNPAILNHNEINKIIKKEKTELTITELIDISKFKIVQNNNVIAIMIEYPILFNRCKLYETRALSQPDGKLIINKEIAKCGNVYQNVQNCKFELRFNYCKTQKDNNTCLIDLLHNERALCNKTKEKDLHLEVIRDGSILLTGNHQVENLTITGTYLLTFENTTTIDGKTYNNPTGQINTFLKTYTVNEYDIGTYFEALDDNLKMENINLLTTIREEITNSPIVSTFGLIILTILIIMTAIIIVYLRRPRHPALTRDEYMSLQVRDIMNRVHAQSP